MDITVKDINTVDKNIIITANRKDLEPKFSEAYKKYKKQIQMPGFRAGKVPVNIIRQRFGDEIEREEVGNYVQEVFENEVVPEYEPVGEPEMLDLSWEDDELEARFKVGTRPDFELANLEDLTVDRMVHDVSDEEVQQELDRAREQEGNWEEVDETITESSKVTVDAIHLDEDGEPIGEETDEDQVIDLRKDEFSAFEDDLLGKKTGDILNVDVGEEGDEAGFKLIIKKVEKLHPAKLTDAFAKEQTDGEARNVDEYKSLLKSRIQNYYDQTANDLFKNEVVDVLVDNHEFEVPEVFVEQVLNEYVQRIQQQARGELPDDFDMASYREEMRERAERDARWVFINEKLQEKFDDIEIQPDDVDSHLSAQAAQYGVTIDQMRNMYAENPQQLESLRNTIRDEKVFDRLGDTVQINDLEKETYRQQHEHQQAE